MALFQTLLDKGAPANDILYVDHKFETLANHCYEKGDKETVKLLLDKGFDAASTTYSGTSSLLGVAIQANDIEYVKYLLDRNTAHSAVRRKFFIVSFS